MAAEDVIKVGVEGTFDGVIPIVYTFHFQIHSPYTSQSDLAQELTVYHDVFHPWLDQHPLEYHLDHFTTRTVLPVLGGITEWAIPSYHDGGHSGSRVTQLAALTSWKTGFPGRSRRGRTYWCVGWSEEAGTGTYDQWGTDVRNTLDFVSSRLDVYLAGGARAGLMTMGVFSRRYQEFTPIVSRVNSKYIATQRRRSAPYLRRRA